MSQFIKSIIKTYVKGSTTTKVLIAIVTLVFLVFLIDLIILILNRTEFQSYFGLAFLGGFSLITYTAVYLNDIMKYEETARKEIETVEKRYLENPNQTSAAWDLAKLKLENYLDRNLMQMKSIFNWTMLVMVVGFCIIGYGVVKAYNTQTVLPSLLTVVSGLLIEFLGASFLFVYKSIMSQAKDFIIVLERINAVGMSVQIIDRIQDDQKLKNTIGADLAKQLLEMYSNHSPKV